MKPYAYRGLRERVGLTSEEYASIYKAWKRMLNRCYDPNNASFYRYDGRINVCTEWKYSFENFLLWSVKNGWAPGLSLDRIDNDGDYEPSNCRWATWKQQSRNRSSCIYLTHDGVTRVLSEWCEIYGVPFYLAHNRLIRGCTDFETLFRKIDLRSGGDLYY